MERIRTANTDMKTMKTTAGVIWQILNALDLALDLDAEQWDAKKELSAERFGITENRFGHYLEMLQDARYVSGVKTMEFTTGTELDYDGISITLDGIRFLWENSAMRKIADAAEKIGLIVAEAGAGFLKDRLSK